MLERFERPPVPKKRSLVGGHCLDHLAALVEMGLGRTIMEFNLNLFKNSLMAHVAVVVEGGRLSDAGRKAVKDFIKDQALGVKNAGRVLLLETEGD